MTLSLPGELTYEIITCPVCGARLKVGHQALSPEYLITDAQCPKCGTVVAHYVVSIELVTGGINISELMNLMITMMIVVMMMKMMVKTMKEVK